MSHETLPYRCGEKIMYDPGKPSDGATDDERYFGPAEDRLSVDHLFGVAYEELRRLAGAVRRSDPGATLNPTALVHEAWMRLSKSPELSAVSPLHFKRIAARAMRQVLIESARRRNAAKRGGLADGGFVTLEDSAHGLVAKSRDLLALDDALSELERIEPRQALLVETRFFGGFDVVETAALLNVSESTAHREWRVARAWLAHQLSKGA